MDVAVLVAAGYAVELVLRQRRRGVSLRLAAASLSGALPQPPVLTLLVGEPGGGRRRVVAAGLAVAPDLPSERALTVGVRNAVPWAGTAVSLPQRILKGALSFVTRRTVDRRFYLKPTAEVTAIIWYAFAAAVIKHGVVPHALVAMSNHLHYLITDVLGLLPAFKRDFHRMVAEAVKALWRIDETVFADCDSRNVSVVGQRGAVEKALYSVLNPVRAGLVETASEWPGAIWRPGMRSVTVKKPDAWFTGPEWPDEITIEFKPPAAWTGSEDAWHEELARMLADEEAALRRERIKHERPVLGARRCIQQSHLAAPKTKEEPKQLDPAIATGGDGELMRQEKIALREWRRAYREALERWKTDKTTTFPEGSYWVVVHHGAQAAG